MKTRQSESIVSDPFEILPQDIIENIFDFLRGYEAAQCCLVSKRWKNWLEKESKSFWKRCLKTEFDPSFAGLRTFKETARDLKYEYGILHRYFAQNQRCWCGCGTFRTKPTDKPDKIERNHLIFVTLSYCFDYSAMHTKILSNDQ